MTQGSAGLWVGTALGWENSHGQPVAPMETRRTSTALCRELLGHADLARLSAALTGLDKFADRSTVCLLFYSALKTFPNAARNVWRSKPKPGNQLPWMDERVRDGADVGPLGSGRPPRARSEEQASNR